MKSLLAIVVVIIFLMPIVSCNKIDKDKAKQFYNDNKNELKLITEQIYLNHYYTYIYIQPVDNNERKIIIQKSDSSYKVISATKIIKDNNFDELIKEYNDKSKTLNDLSINNLKIILAWMIDHSVEIISLKSPEMDNLTIKLDIFSGICYQEKGKSPPDVSKFEELDKNWYYVTFK